MNNKIKGKDSAYNSNYIGQVVDVDDPKKYGRVRVRVYPMFSLVTATDIPWAVPAFGVFEGAQENGIGSFCVPKVGSMVYVFFQGGDIYQPVYFAETTTGIHGLPASRLTNYPNRKVWKTKGGFEEILDDTEDKALWQLTTPSGYDWHLDDGNEEYKLTGPEGNYLRIAKDGGPNAQYRYQNPNGSHLNIENDLYTISKMIVRWDFGPDVASASTITLPDKGNTFYITGTTNISNITLKRAGTVVHLIFTGVMNVLLGGNISSAAGALGTMDGATLSLVSDGTRWREIARTPNKVTGEVTVWGGSIASIPAGELACDGTSYSTTTYAALFSKIGYTHGGSGSSFKVPNFVNVFPFGAGGAAVPGSRNPLPGGGDMTLSGSDNNLWLDQGGNVDQGTEGTPRSMAGSDGIPGQGQNLLNPYIAVPWKIKT